MATTAERLGVVETKVENLDEKLDEIKVDVKDMHDCLDRTGETLKAQLNSMHQESCRQHNDLANKITELERIKRKYTTYAMMALAFIAGAGWSGAINFPMILKFFGI